MTVSLTKGGNVSLTKEDPGLENITVGLGWKPRTSTGADFDLDASALLVGEDGKVASQNDFIFFNNLTSPDGSVTLAGDNLTGEGEGDDEQITVKLPGVSDATAKIIVAVSIHEADTRQQNFGQVGDAYIRVVNSDTDTEIARYDLTEDASTETAMVFGELYRHDGGWKFRAVGQAYASGLHGIVADHGVTL